MKGEFEAEKNLPDFLISFAESALRVASSGGRKKVEPKSLSLFTLALTRGSSVSTWKESRTVSAF